MSKSKDPAYLKIRLERSYLRKENRKEKRQKKYLRYGRGSSKCVSCGNAMTWCSCCEMWSSTCCEDYGTCQCI